MCAHYEGIKDPKAYAEHFSATAPASEVKVDLWPGYVGAFIRRHPHADVGDEAVPQCEAVAGVFGLVPHWATDLKLARSTYNARSETVASKPSFRDAWKKACHCIIPANAIYEPDWRSGKAVPTRITRADGQPMGIAGLWDSWKQPDGQWIHSFTMLTINADQHELMNQFHKPTDEKRMVVVLSEEHYGDWLSAPMESSTNFLRPYRADKLIAAQSNLQAIGQTTGQS
ncbi:SOS response-associated peptidase [Rhodoferax aquaticus]|uniref:Abasic site processing protein n=1 Tax=Rhodoferax aquaticus TaxID=2527691 RepID=A0A515EQN9_9BURK|nr:SOS response-associated peptidase [Rhodoferax aquaticus]QDL54983.1 SOS response-associated peptidase [Rhodoferax aquaticus]